MWEYNQMTPISNDELCHHGVKGQKWGVIRSRSVSKTGGKSKKKYVASDRKAPNSLSRNIYKKKQNAKKFIDNIDKNKALHVTVATAATASAALYFVGAFAPAAIPVASVVGKAATATGLYAELGKHAVKQEE